MRSVSKVDSVKNVRYKFWRLIKIENPDMKMSREVTIYYNISLFNAALFLKLSLKLEFYLNRSVYLKLAEKYIIYVVW